MNTITRRDCLAALAASHLASSAALCSAAENKRPNILLILSGDQGYGDLSIHGNPFLRTPNIDGFARQIECTRFYVSPVCAPHPIKAS